MVHEEFGQQLYDLRTQAKLSIRALAEKAEVDHAYIHRLENDRKDSPSVEVIRRLSLVLGVAMCVRCGMVQKKHWSANFSDGQHVAGGILICPTSLFTAGGKS